MFDSGYVLDVLRSQYDPSFTGVDFHRDGGSLSYIARMGDTIRFLRVIRPQLRMTALQSIDIHLHLQRNHFPVPPIIFTAKQEPYVEISHQGEAYLLILYEYIEGTEPAPEDTEDVGALIGRLHRIMKDYPVPLAEHDKHFFIDRYIGILHEKNYPKVQVYEQIGQRLWDAVKHLPRGFCHGDLYKGNILKAENGSLYVLDFDTACHAFPMYDAALYCNDADYFNYTDEGFEDSQAQLTRFVQGYRRENTLTEKEVQAFNIMLAIYHFQLQATIVEIYGLNCNKEGFEDKQLDIIIRWLQRAQQEMNHDILKDIDYSFMQ